MHIAPVDEYMPLTPEALETSLQELVNTNEFLLGFDELAASLRRPKKKLKGIVKIRCEAAQARPEAAGGNDLDCSR
jgi:hypothetical protein